MKFKDLLPRMQNSRTPLPLISDLDSPSNEDTSHIFAIGEVDGNILEAYAKIFDKEKELGVTASWVVSPGSMGIWPDFKYIDRATRTHGDVGDFHKLYYEQWNAPRNTLFVSGAHEDHLWLQRRWKSRDTQLLGNFWYLNNGFQTTIGPSITGMGKVYSPKVFNGEKVPKQLKYYTRREIERACSCGPTDILLSHQAPQGEMFGSKKSNSEGLKTLMYAVRPKVLIHSGYKYSQRYECLGVQCVSLNKMEIVVFKWDHKTKEISFA